MENTEKQLKDQVHILPNIGTAQEFISAFIDVLESNYKNFSTHSMNEHALFLQGQKDMLGQVITLLKQEKNNV